MIRQTHPNVESFQAASIQVELDTRNRELGPGGGFSEAEPRLGPYETRYTVEMGYASPPRTVA